MRIPAGRYPTTRRNSARVSLYTSTGSYDFPPAASSPHRAHDARHTAATLLLVQGVPEVVSMQILGHTDLRVTRRYQHVADELLQDAADRVGAALWR